MNRVLVHIPSNSSNRASAIRYALDVDKANAVVQEGMEDSNSHYAGARIIPTAEWPLHRFVASKDGHPIQDPEVESLTRAEIADKEAQLAYVDEADVSTVGSMAAQLAQMQDMMQSMKKQIDTRDETIVAQSAQLDAEKERVATLGKPKPRAAAKKVNKRA